MPGIFCSSKQGGNLKDLSKNTISTLGEVQYNAEDVLYCGILLVLWGDNIIIKDVQYCRRVLLVLWGISLSLRLFSILRLVLLVLWGKTSALRMFSTIEGYY